jgi:anoctamin-10
MRLDAFKLCKGRRRPLAEKTGGIGVWEHLLHIVAVISILTNCWLMGFTSSSFYRIREKGGDIALFTVVVAWEHVMLLIKYIMQTSMSPLPKSVRDAIKREQHEKDKQRNSTMLARRLQHQREEIVRGEHM